MKAPLQLYIVNRVSSERNVSRKFSFAFRNLFAKFRIFFAKFRIFFAKINEAKGENFVKTINNEQLIAQKNLWNFLL